MQPHGNTFFNAASDSRILETNQQTKDSEILINQQQIAANQLIQTRNTLFRIISRNTMISHQFTQFCCFLKYMLFSRISVLATAISNICEYLGDLWNIPGLIGIHEYLLNYYKLSILPQ